MKRNKSKTFKDILKLEQSFKNVVILILGCFESIGDRIFVGCLRLEFLFKSVLRFEFNKYSLTL